MMVRFVEVASAYRGTSINQPRLAKEPYALSEVWINQNYVISLKDSPAYRKLLEEGNLPSDLAADHHFTAVTTSHGGVVQTHVVVGELSAVAQKLNHPATQLLKG